MEGKIALEEHFSINLNNTHRDAKGKESRNGIEYARDIEKRLLDPELPPARNGSCRAISKRQGNSRHLDVINAFMHRRGPQ